MLVSLTPMDYTVKKMQTYLLHSVSSLLWDVVFAFYRWFG